MSLKRKKYLPVILLAFLMPSCQDSEVETEKFLNEYTKIRLISYDTFRNTYMAADTIELTNDSVVISNIRVVDNIELNEKDAGKIVNILFTDIEEGHLTDCYYPRHILLFYKEQKIVDYYEFSVSCGGFTKSANINFPPFCMEHGEKIIRIFKDMKLKNNGEESDSYIYF